MRFFQRGIHGVDVRFQSGDPGIQGFLFPACRVQAFRQGGGLGLVSRVLGLLRCQRGLKRFDLGGQTVFFLLGVSFHTVYLFGEGDDPVFHDLRFIFGVFQGLLGGVDLRLQDIDFALQQFPVLTGLGSALFQSGSGGLIGPGIFLLLGQGGLELLDLGVQAVLFLLGVRLEAVDLLGEGDNPVLHDFRFIPGLGKGVPGLGSFRPQAGDLLIQRRLFLFHGGHACTQGVHLGIPNVLFLQDGGSGFLRRGQFRGQRGQTGFKFTVFRFSCLPRLGQGILEIDDLFPQGIRLAGQSVLFLVRGVQCRLDLIDAALQLGGFLILLFFSAFSGLLLQGGIQRLNRALGISQFGTQLFGLVLQGRFFLGTGLQGGFGVLQFLLQLRPFLIAYFQRFIQRLMLLLQRLDLLLHFFRGQHVPVGGGTCVRRGPVLPQARTDQNAAGHQRDAHNRQYCNHPFFLHPLCSPFSILTLRAEQDKKPLSFFSG